VLPRMSIQEMNKQLSIINRVVIHPKYRTIGFGAKIIHETLPMVGTPYVELIAVMAKYLPFVEKEGMQKIAEQHAAKNLEKISRILEALGFNLHLLGSLRYVQAKLEELDNRQTFLKKAFVENTHPRLKSNSFFRHFNRFICLFVKTLERLAVIYVVPYCSATLCFAHCIRM